MFGGQLIHAVLVCLLVGNVLAHHEHNLVEEKELRRRFLDSLNNKALEQCTIKLQKSGVAEKTMSRRLALAHGLRKRGLENHGGECSASCSMMYPDISDR
jgi:hypothetical protein